MGKVTNPSHHSVVRESKVMRDQTQAETYRLSSVTIGTHAGGILPLFPPVIKMFFLAIVIFVMKVTEEYGSM